MKKLAAVIIILFSLSFILGACKKDNRKPGICYCEFFSGDDQEYDLTHLSRAEQMEQCQTHDNNAGHFGGECELE